MLTPGGIRGEVAGSTRAERAAAKEHFIDPLRMLATHANAMA